MRRRKANVELFEEMRREYEFGIRTIQGVARKFEVEVPPMLSTANVREMLRGDAAASAHAATGHRLGCPAMGAKPRWRSCALTRKGEEIPCL